MYISLFGRFYLLILCFFCYFSVKGQNQTNLSPIETPIRFQVSIPTNLPNSNEVPFYESDWGVLILPKTYTATGKSTPLVIGCHGGGGSVSSTGSQTESYDLYKYLVSLGYAVMDMAGMPETYSKRLKIDHYRCVGSFIAIRSYMEGYKWVIENYNIDTTGCYVNGGSNGGLTATNIVCQSSIPVKCESGMSPLLSIKEQAWNISSGALSGGEFSSFQNRANIIRIYGMRDVYTIDELLKSEYEDDKVGLWDPFMYLIALRKNKYRCPVKIWHPVDDDIVKIEFSRRFIRSLIQNKNDAELIEMAGGGHSPEYYGLPISKFSYQGNLFELKQSVYELAKWYGTYSGIYTEPKSTDSSIVNIDAVKFYPNPIEDYLNISNDNINQAYSIKIYDISGKEIINKYKNMGDIQLGLKGLSKGIYIVNINTGSKNNHFKVSKK